MRDEGAELPTEYHFRTLQEARRIVLGRAVSAFAVDLSFQMLFWWLHDVVMWLHEMTAAAGTAKQNRTPDCVLHRVLGHLLGKMWYKHYVFIAL